MAKLLISIITTSMVIITEMIILIVQYIMRFCLPTEVFTDLDKWFTLKVLLCQLKKVHLQ